LSAINECSSFGEPEPISSTYICVKTLKLIQKFTGYLATSFNIWCLDSALRCLKRLFFFDDLPFLDFLFSFVFFTLKTVSPHIIFQSRPLPKVTTINPLVDD
jgi:hypothetical protein